MKICRIHLLCAACALGCSTLSPTHAADAAPAAAQESAPPSSALSAPVENAEVIVYGGTPSGVMAAVAAARHGHTVALIDINSHVGGVVSGGLVATDMGDRKTVGGLADEFLKRVVKFYGDTYGLDSPQLAACGNGRTYEPHVAEMVFEQMINEQKPRIAIWRKHRFHSVTLDGNRVAALVVEDLVNHAERTFTGQIFIDASYEGDLMAGAHVPYRVGREARSEYDEFLAGINAGPKEVRGLGDHRTMAYNFRASLTFNTENRVLFPKPDHYDPEPFRRTDGERIKRGTLTTFGGLFTTLEKAGPNGKFHANWCDFIGNSEGYADGDWETRARIEAREKNFFLSLLYYLQNDPELPESFREDAQRWGFPKDEFADNGHFPFQLYVREARRMVGRYVLRERDLTQDRSKPDGVCAGSYGVDCHWVQQILDDGKLVTEQTRHVALNPYDIPYASLTPIEPVNLLVPLCLSATHVAYCSLRMEPVYMMLGHAAGDAAHLAIEAQTTAQNVDPQKLRELLLKEGAVVDAGYQPPMKILWTPEHPKPGEQVQFHVETGALKDPINQIWWDFEGNGQVAANESRASYSFKLDKVYTVSVIAQDQAGRRRLVSARVPVGQAEGRDIAIDDFDAELFGRWDGTYPLLSVNRGERIPDVFFGPGIHADVMRNGQKAPARARFVADIPRAGHYQVCLGFRAAKNQATNMPLILRNAGKAARLTVDERTETTPFNFTPLGDYEFKAGSIPVVELTNHDTDGRVVIDGLRLLWLGD